MRTNYEQPMRTRVESYDGDSRQGCLFFLFFFCFFISSFRRVLTWRLHLRVVHLSTDSGDGPVLELGIVHRV